MPRLVNGCFVEKYVKNVLLTSPPPFPLFLQWEIGREKIHALSFIGCKNNNNINMASFVKLVDGTRRSFFYFYCFYFGVKVLKRGAENNLNIV